MIGTILDKYEVLQKVGEGGMATVYRGRHCTLNRDVAIKVLHPHLSSSARNRKRFAREARAIEHLRHPNILEIFDYSGVDADECYIITEFVEGETLSTLLRRHGRLPSEIATIVGLHLARALAYAHGEGILHRDLKPDNVMVRADGTLKLMDFGIARFLDESQVTMTGALVGSPAFMSPEQARELPLDPRSDLFSLGTMLFYLVTGELPFSGSNPSLVLKNVIEGHRPSVSELAPAMSATLADAIERLMSPSPDDRFSDADEVRRTLECALAEANVDPEDARWSLTAWLDDPEGYEQRLNEHLRQVLLLRGKKHLDAGDHLDALRLFNRLLSMDEDHAEVLELVQRLHGSAQRRPSAGILGLVALAALLLLGGGWLLWSEPRATDAAATGPLTEGPRSPVAAPLVAAPPPAEELRPEPVPPPAPVESAAPTPPAGGPLSSASSSNLGGTRPISTSDDRLRATLPRHPSQPPAGLPLGGDALAAAETSETREPMAKVLLRSRSELLGDIWIDDKKLGQTRDPHPIELPAGSYEVVVKSRYVQPVRFRLEVEPGELYERTLDLRAVPGKIEFRSQDYVESCIVRLDGADVGTVGQLDPPRILLVDPPNRPHAVEVDCDGEVTRKRYSFVPPHTPFPAP